MAYGYDRYGNSGGSENTAVGTNSGWNGMSGLVDKMKDQNTTMNGMGLMGGVFNVGMGLATSNPIQVVMGLAGGLNEIMAASKERKAKRMQGLQSIGKGW